MICEMGLSFRLKLLCHSSKRESVILQKTRRGVIWQLSSFCFFCSLFVVCSLSAVGILIDVDWSILSVIELIFALCFAPLHAVV